MQKEKDFMFTYNSPLSCQNPTGMKQKTIKAVNKTQARIIIKEFLVKHNSTLGIEFF